MRRLFLLTVLFLFASCTFFENREPEVSYDKIYECAIPEDIPKTLHDGTKISWDCDWASSYRDGNVYVIYAKDGRVLSVARNVR
jgi:hypothetical protein